MRVEIHKRDDGVRLITTFVEEVDGQFQTLQTETLMGHETAKKLARDMQRLFPRRGPCSGKAIAPSYSNLRAPRNERLELRLSSELKMRLKEMAHLKGRSLSDAVIVAIEQYLANAEEN